MSVSNNTAAQNTGAAQKDTVPSPTGWRMASRLEETNGILRVDSDGKIIEEDTGDLIHLDVPDNEAQEYYAEVNPYAPYRRFAIPESKNGATALDDPRARKPILRVVKNWLTGSSKPPAQEPQWAFATALRGWSPMNPGRKPGKIMFGNMVEARRHEGSAQVRKMMVQVLEGWFDGELRKVFGREWARNAGEKEKFLGEVEDYVAKMVDGAQKVEEGDEEYEAAVPVDSVAVEAVVEESVAEESVAEAPKKRGWLW